MYMRSEQIIFGSTLQRANTENSKQIFPETELLGHSPSFHIQVSLSDLFIPRIAPHYFLKQNRQISRGNI
jgi:hypothetical protein